MGVIPYSNSSYGTRYRQGHKNQHEGQEEWWVWRQ